MTDTVFTKIINRELPGHFVYEDDLCVVIVDRFPALKGQTMVIPKEPVPYVFDLPDETYTHLFAIAKKIAIASDSAFDAVRTCLVVEGLDVPHVHIKIYPLRTEETSLAKEMINVAEASEETMAQIATQLQAALNR